MSFWVKKIKNNITGQVINSFIFNEENILKGLGAIQVSGSPTSPSPISKIGPELALFVIIASGSFFVGVVVAWRLKS